MPALRPQAGERWCAYEPCRKASRGKRRVSPGRCEREVSRLPEALPLLATASEVLSLMPTRPLRPCTVPGCPALSRGGPCAQHKGTISDRTAVARKEADAKKGPDRAFYWSKPWREVRARVLAEEPSCFCGCGLPSNTVDHVKNRREYPALALERANLHGWYDRCHNRKTATLEGGFGNAIRR